MIGGAAGGRKASVDPSSADASFFDVAFSGTGFVDPWFFDVSFSGAFFVDSSLYDRSFGGRWFDLAETADPAAAPPVPR